MAPAGNNNTEGKDSQRRKEVEVLSLGFKDNNSVLDVKAQTLGETSRGANTPLMGLMGRQRRA